MQVTLYLCYYVSFDGQLTYPNNKKYIEMVNNIPNDLLLVETNSPHFTPNPICGIDNESSFIRFIIDKISKIKEMDYDKVDKLTKENTKKLFKKLK